MKNIIISEGRSNAYLVHGMGILALMGCGAMWTSYAFLLLPLALALFFASSGVEIDQRKRRVRKYIGLANFRRGIWIPLRHFTEVELDETVVAFKQRSFFRYQMSTSRTFDLLGKSAEGDQFQINDFFDYNQAVECGEAISKLMGIKFENHYAQKTAEMMRRPRRR